MPNDSRSVEDNLLHFAELLLEAQLISHEQADALQEFIAESLPFYKENAELTQRVAEVSAELASVVGPDMSCADARRAIPPALVQRFVDLPRVLVKLDSLGTEELTTDKRLHPFIAVGLLRTLGGKIVSHHGSPALMSTLLARLSYSHRTLVELTRLAGREANKQVSAFLAETQGKLVALPARMKQSILSAANKTAHSFLTSEYQTAGALPDMLNIYEFGRCFYLDDYESVFVFSYTSGLVIPTEHMGAIDDENIRTGYFDDALLGPCARTMERYYQWDSIGTAKKLYSNYLVAEHEGRGVTYVEQAKQLLAKSLQERNLEITEAEFGSMGGGIKLLLPIIGRGGVMFSNRHPVSRKMAYANLLAGISKDVFLSETLSQFTSMPILNRWSPPLVRSPNSTDSLTYSEAIRKYIYEIEVSRRIKQMNQVLDYKVASEIVDQLIDRGKSIVERDGPSTTD